MESLLLFHDCPRYTLGCRNWVFFQ